MAHLSTSSSSSSASTSATSDGAGAGAGASSGSALQESMDKLVDTAVELVESGRLAQAVQVLQHGIEALSTAFPGSPELSELHNQAGLLLFFADKQDEAATHAEAALDITHAHFGATHPLTAHRLLRLGAVRVGQGRPLDAAPLLGTAADALAGQAGDAGGPEATFYLTLLQQVLPAQTAADVAGADGALVESLRRLVSLLGGESMIVRLALGQHSRVVGRALDRSFELGEALFKQHMRLQELQDPQSAELGLTAYQLAVTYYAQDMLQDAHAQLQRATQLLRQHYPDDHDMVALCKHRLGMLCAAKGDHRSATALLTETGQRYAAQQEGHPLQREAELGLGMARFRALDPRLPADERRQQQSELLSQMQAATTDMARALGSEHLLVGAAARYQAQLAVLAGLR